MTTISVEDNPRGEFFKLRFGNRLTFDQVESIRPLVLEDLMSTEEARRVTIPEPADNTLTFNNEFDCTETWIDKRAFYPHDMYAPETLELYLGRITSELGVQAIEIEDQIAI